MVQDKINPAISPVAASDALVGVRRRIDSLDDRMHDLLMERALLIEEVADAKQAGNIAALRLGREAQILRRLAARHQGRFPRANLLRIWREIMSGSIAMQADLTVAALAGSRALARDHFGGMNLLGCRTAEDVLRAVTGGRAALGVLPLPQGGEPQPWWPALADYNATGPRIVARLPFGGPGKDGAEALVVGEFEAEPSGDDVSVLVIVDTGAPRRARLVAACGAEGLTLEPIASSGDAHLFALDGPIAPGDGRMERALQPFGSGPRVAVLGSYARPLAPE
jgi:chorismate mutase / prephenate dehydratase